MAGQTDRELIECAFDTLALNPVDTIMPTHSDVLLSVTFLDASDRATLQDIWDNGVALLPSAPPAAIQAADALVAEMAPGQEGPT